MVPAPPRRMLAFERDEGGEWVARLECGHRRHVRHRPPLSSYPWIADEAGRAAKIGASIECDRCARSEVPDEARVYRRTEIFDERSLPSGLRRPHRTRAGVWGRVDVLAGRLRLTMPALGIDAVIEAGDQAILPPELEHQVEPLGPVRLQIAFLRVGPDPAAGVVDG